MPGTWVLWWCFCDGSGVARGRHGSPSWRLSYLQDGTVVLIFLLQPLRFLQDLIAVGRRGEPADGGVTTREQRSGFGVEGGSGRDGRRTEKRRGG